MLTSVGCNAPDYLLDDPAAIHAIDVNPRQNALLKLKLALFERGDFDNLFARFGNGSHSNFRSVYNSVRPGLPDYARTCRDRKIECFSTNNRKQSFYYHGGSGAVAWLLTRYLLRDKRWLKTHIMEQPMTMLGVPRAQVRLINKEYPGGLRGFLSDKLRRVATGVLIRDDYTGSAATAACISRRSYDSPVGHRRRRRALLPASCTYLRS